MSRQLTSLGHPYYVTTCQRSTISRTRFQVTRNYSNQSVIYTAYTHDGSVRTARAHCSRSHELTYSPASIPAKADRLASPSTSTAHLSRSPPHAPPIDYASSAPVPPSGSKHLNGHQGDEEVPDHLYERLPEHLMTVDEKGRKVPDYLKMILMCGYFVNA